MTDNINIVGKFVDRTGAPPRKTDQPVLIVHGNPGTVYIQVGSEGVEVTLLQARAISAFINHLVNQKP